MQLLAVVLFTRENDALQATWKLDLATNFLPILAFGTVGAVIVSRRPGNVVGAPTFGRITSTRFPTGESGSSRQVQLALQISL